MRPLKLVVVILVALVFAALESRPPLDPKQTPMH
jgi:hypothetical protein